MTISSDLQYFVVSRADGSWVVNNPRLPTVRYWTLRSVVESWVNEWAPDGMIILVSADTLDKINRELAGG